MKTRRLPQSVFLWVALSLLPLPLSFAAVDEYNVPREVNVCVKNTSGLAINGDINPFYLSADFDGDGKLDFAVQVIGGGSRGILICLSTQRTRQSSEPVLPSFGLPLKDGVLMLGLSFRRKAELSLALRKPKTTPFYWM